MKKKFSISFFHIFILLSNPIFSTDVTIVGPFNYKDGLGRLPIVFVEMLQDNLNLNCVPTGYIPDEIPLIVKKIISNSFSSAGKVSIFFDLLGKKLKSIPKESLIKIAYSMFESTMIPSPWVEILNNNFDAVIVPDKFLVNVYYNSGVKIPIFVLPLPLYLENYLSVPIKKKINQVFTFGMSNGYFTNRKNHLLLIKAFVQEFGNTPNVKLRVHWQPRGLQEKQFAKEAGDIIRNYKNVELIRKFLTKDEHVNFMSSLDCYVLLSTGEGFSNTPREAQAMGIPCILSNNTAHKTICETGLVLPVVCDIKEPAYYPLFKKFLGYQFNCTIENVRSALREMYTNYPIYLDKVKLAKKWVKQYDYKSLKKYYLTLIRPKNIQLSDKNQITDEVLMTNSEKLFKKYNQLVTGNH